MGVLIPCMEMPRSCRECRFFNYEGMDAYSCKALSEIIHYDDGEVFKPWKQKYKKCPLEKSKDIVLCENCVHQYVQFHEDKRFKDGGYYIYFCNLCEDPFVAHGACGVPGEYCIYGEQKC